MENDVFRPSLSDFGLRPQQMVENNEANSGRGLFVLGSEQSMLPWRLEGIPFNHEEFQKMRQRLIQEGHGPEVSLSIACGNLNEYICGMEYQRSPELRTGIREARNTLKYLQHLLLLCGKGGPRAYNAATITFNKRIESGNNLSLLSDDETFAETTKQMTTSEAAMSESAVRSAKTQTHGLR